MNRLAFLVALLAGASLLSNADSATHVVHYHANDIVPIRAKMRYTTLVEIPSGEKIMEAATGDRDFWIIEAVQNYYYDPENRIIQVDARHVLDCDRLLPLRCRGQACSKICRRYRNDLPL